MGLNKAQKKLFIIMITKYHYDKKLFLFTRQRFKEIGNIQVIIMIILCIVIPNMNIAP